jgi:DNA-binding NarL/FixJ family response regulator
VSVLGSPPRRPRLIVADDDVALQSLLSSWLESEFRVVGLAGDGEEAVALAKRTQPDVALIDVEMPKGGGPHAVRGIVEVAARTAIVILSIDESDTVVRDLIRAGAVAYCRKGIDPHDLAELLGDAIHARTQEREGSRRALSPTA